MPSRTLAPTDPSLAALTDAFRDFLRALRHLRGRAAAEAEEAELSLSQYQLLVGLEDDAPLGLRELAALAGVAPPTATRMLDGLEARGLVARTRREDDRRAVAIELTAAGHELVAAKRAFLVERWSEVFAGFTPEERRQAVHLLERLSGAVEAFR